ncbi:MAG: hypothetical protein LBL94_02945 [Prevotellaceae bacterium]|nr:hypothetical protein [Prevotellaceae bacterium]
MAAAFSLSIGLLQAQGASPVALKISTVHQATAGEDPFTVKVSINKQNTQGFARFHVDLPKGFEADEIESENAGAVFDFRDQRVRFVWANLPEEHEVSISYRIRITEPRLKGNLSLIGRFTYTVGSERQIADAAAQVTIVPSLSVAAAQAIDIEAYQNEDAQPSGATSPSPQVAAAQATDVEAAPNEAAQPLEETSPNLTPEASAVADSGEVAAASTGSSVVKTSGIFAVRQKPYMVDKEYYVNIQITKAQLSGSGRVDEELTASVSKVEAIETKGAQFSVDGTKISFVWTEIPQDTGNFVIAYKVTPWQGNAPLSVQGMFTYSDNSGNASSVNIVEREVDFSIYVPVPPLAAAASQAPEAPLVNQKESQPVQRGLVFKVQLLATRQPVKNRDAYFSRYNITEAVAEEVYEFDPRQYTYKYVVGPFKKYEQAQKYRDLAWRKGITDAFVTCYYNGNRITIQEALMISNKKR